MGIKSDGEAYLYDLVNINGVKIEEAPRNRSTTDGDTAVRFGTSSNTTIPQNEDGVNTKSMQNSEIIPQTGKNPIFRRICKRRRKRPQRKKPGLYIRPGSFLNRVYYLSFYLSTIAFLRYFPLCFVQTGKKNKKRKCLWSQQYQGFTGIFSMARIRR